VHELRNADAYPIALTPSMPGEVGRFPLTFVDDGAGDQNGCAGGTIQVPFSIPYAPTDGATGAIDGGTGTFAHAKRQFKATPLTGGALKLTATLN
jgi:hypothetical protein